MGRRLRAISEVTAVIVMVMIAVVAAFGLKTYIDYQNSKLPTTDIALARYSVSYGSPSNAVVTLVVSNLLPYSLNITSVSVVFSNGSVYQYTPTPSQQAVPAKSDGQVVFTVSMQPGSSIARVLVTVVDTSTGRSQVIAATGG